MADNKYTIQEIADYLNGTMNPEQAALLRIRIEEDKALFNEVEEQRKLSRVVQIAALKKKLSAVHAEFDTRPEEQNIVSIKQAKPKKINWPLLALAATITGIILFMVVFKSGQSYNNKLYNKYFTDDNGAPSLMGNATTPFDQAMVYYKAGEYEKASAGFNKLLKQQYTNDTLKYYEALSLMRIEQNSKALTLLHDIKAPEGSDLDIKAKWYAALIYLEQGHDKETIGALSGLKQLNSPYAKKAASLTEELSHKTH